MNLFDEISSWPTLHARHEAAPSLRKREQYLATMLKRGVNRTVVRTTATDLIQIVRLLRMTSLRKVELKEIEAAGRKWAAYQSPLRGNPSRFVELAEYCQSYSSNGNRKCAASR